MKVAYVFGPGDLRINEVDAPYPGRGDVVLKIATVGRPARHDALFRSLGRARHPRDNRARSARNPALRGVSPEKAGTGGFHTAPHEINAHRRSTWLPGGTQ